MFSNKSCTPYRNVAFIRTHGTNGHIVTNILQRYGENHYLNFVLPKLHPADFRGNDHGLGWPRGFDENLVENLPTHQTQQGEYNILCNEARYSKSLRRIMPTKTKFVTILADPENVRNTLSREYSQREQLDLTRREKTDQSDERDEHSTLPNGMAFDLGYDPILNNKTDLARIEKFIHKISDDFDLVLISEYFAESMVLLAYELCMDLKDVLFLPKRLHKMTIFDSDEKKLKPTKSLDSIDKELYEFFLMKFWARVGSYGPAFREDLEEFRRVLRRVEEGCDVPAGRKGVEGFPCREMGLGEGMYTERLRRQQQIRNML